MATWNWRRILTIVAIPILVLLLVSSCTAVLWNNFLKPADALTASPTLGGELAAEEEEDMPLEDIHIIVETFQIFPSGSLDPFSGIQVWLKEPSDFFSPTLVGQTAMDVRDGSPVAVWENFVEVGSWVTVVDPEDECVLWKVGSENWDGWYLVSAEYAEQAIPLKFQLICGENIPSPTPTNPPSGGPTETPPVPTNTPPSQPTATPTSPPPTSTPRPTEVDCNCETPETAVPTPEPPTEATSTPIW